jgi:hypothetical protein
MLKRPAARAAVAFSFSNFPQGLKRQSIDFWRTKVESYGIHIRNEKESSALGKLADRSLFPNQACAER